MEIVPAVDKESVKEIRRRKISCFGWKNKISYWVVEFTIPLCLFAYFIWSLYRCYDSNSTTDFWISITFGLFAPWFISLISFCTIKKRDSNQQCTLFRWLFHIIPLPSIPRGLDILNLKRKCANADDTNFMGLSDRLIAASSSFTFLEQLGTCLELEPQLFFSLYQICLVILSKKNPLSDGGWQDVGEVFIFSLPALAWKLVNNRKCLNFSRDDEREMSTEHTILLFFSRYLTGFGRLVPLAMLLAHSTVYFWIFYSVHVAIVSITLSATFIRRRVKKKPLSSVFNDNSFCWNNALSLGFTISSLYSIEDYRLKEGNLSETVYYAIPFIENLFLFIFLAYVSIPYCTLFVLSMILYFIGLCLQLVCDTFRLDVPVGDASESSSPTEIPILTLIIRWTTSSFRYFFERLCRVFSSCYSALLSILFYLPGGAARQLREKRHELVILQPPSLTQLEHGEQSAMVAQPTLVDDGTTQNKIVMSSEVVGDEQEEEVKDINADVLMPIWEDKKRNDTSAGTIRQRHIPSKEWKDVDELLRDGDLPDEAKSAINRKDVNWICQNMRRDLFQVLTLMLAENGVNLNARNHRGITPALQLCRNYNEEDLPRILELLINKGAEVKALHPEYGMTMLHLVCRYYSHRNLKHIVYLLIKAGIPVNAKTKDEKTALHLLAIFYEHDDMKYIVDLLIKARVQVEARDVFGNTALHLLATYYKHNNIKDIVDLLIEKGVPVYAEDNFGNTALHLFCEYYKNDHLEEIVRLIRAKGARLDVLNHYGLTPLLVLCGSECKLKHIEVFSLLTPDARDDPFLSHTQSVTRLIKEFGEKRISTRDLYDGLENIHKDVKEKWIGISKNPLISIKMPPIRRKL